MKSKENLTTFDKCELGRKKYAEILTSIVATYRDGFVLAVNGKWGTGKTTFMKMWQNELNNQGYRTIFFNAWENDFTSEPLVALLGEIKSLTTTEKDLAFDNILEKTAKFASAVIPALAKTAVTLAGCKDVADAVGKISEATVSIMNDEIKCYDEKKESLQSIREDLAKFVKEKCGDNPLVFIVDELDRCRPDYAVEVLEKIKHLFSVDGIVFVLSIDKEQLSHAVRGYYGSEKIDSPEYLRRFIDLEYTLPEPNYHDYISYLYSKQNIPACIGWSGKDITSTLIPIIEYLCQREQYSLRQVEKIFSLVKIILKHPTGRTKLHIDVVFFLITLKEFHQSLYNDIKGNKSYALNAKQINEIFKEYFLERKMNDSSPLNFLATVTKVVSMMKNSSERDYRISSQTLKECFPNALKLIESNGENIIGYIGQEFEGLGEVSEYTDRIDLLDNLNL